MPTIRVYKFGLLAPTENAALVEQQMLAAHRYRNALVQIERERRDALRILTRDSDVNIRSLEEAVNGATEVVVKLAREIKLQHSETRSRLSTQTDKEELKNARLKLKEAKTNLNLARKQVRGNQTVIDAMDYINDAKNAKIKVAREASGVYWGSYLPVEDAMNAAAKSPMYDGDKPNDPRFVRWQGDGTIAVQLQGGLSVEDSLLGKNTQFRIDPVDEKAFYAEKRSERRKASRTFVHLRVQSTDKGKPIWAIFPLIMHRPLPEGGVIKWAYIHKKMHGPRAEWYLTITIDLAKVPTNTETNGAIALDIGWREIKDKDGNIIHIRAGKWQDEDGNIGEIKLDYSQAQHSLIGALKKANELRGIRDDNFNSIKKTLTEWMKSSTPSIWLKEIAETLPQWRSAARLAHLAKQWKINRFKGDDDIFQQMEKWRYHDYHLWSWEHSQRIKTIRRRRELYRTTSAKLAAKYQTLVIENFDLRDVSQTAQPEDAEDKQRVRANKTLVSPSQLIANLTNAFKAKGGSVVKVNPSGTSFTCHVCDSHEHLDHTTIWHRCSQCGTEWDREDNATANMLKRWREHSGGAQKGRDARTDENSKENEEVQETRYQRRNRAKKEKEARLATARKAAANLAKSQVS
jgi:hypothetical protein